MSFSPLKNFFFSTFKMQTEKATKKSVNSKGESYGKLLKVYYKAEGKEVIQTFEFERYSGSNYLGDAEKKKLAKMCKIDLEAEVKECKKIFVEMCFDKKEIYIQKIFTNKAPENITI